ncbi:MAG: alpha/beta hydrolase [Sphingomonadaceae bacterium]|nr:alpha/beta hydrolase [Sphingomonadaceae bacterium]
MPYVTTRDDTRLYYKSWGSGRPVVLIHGWPLNADSWDDVALGLAGAGFRAIAYDRRGFGRSDQPWDGYDYDTLADDLVTVIEGTCGGEQAAIAGFSMGGGEVARYLAKHGTAKVGHAALISSVVPFMLKRDDNRDGVDPSVFDGMKEGIGDDRTAFMQTFGKMFYGVGFIEKPVSQGVLDWTFQMAMMGGLWPTLACANAFATTDFRPDTAAFDLPTLILHGTGDETVPIDTGGRAAAKRIPHARLIEYDGAPHGLLATNKAEVTRDLVNFLNGAQVSATQESDALQPAM